MRLLLLDKYCPGHFRPLLAWLGQQKGHKIVFLSEYRRKDYSLDGIIHVPVKVPRAASKGGAAEDGLAHMIRRAEAFAAAMRKLKDGGFTPDAICLDGANGCSLYAGDIFPGSPQIGAFECYAARHDAPSEGEFPATEDLAGQRVRGLFQLGALQSCARTFTNSQWQKNSFPEPWRSRMEVLPEGVDTDFFSPGSSRVRVGVAGVPGEIVTYIARTLTPQSGFATFYRALPEIFAARPHCYALIVGYPEKAAEGQEDRFQTLLQSTPVDRQRAHFVNFCAPEEYRTILRGSNAHVFLHNGLRTPSGLLEAMACGCLLVASDTLPVRGILRHEENALLTSYDDPSALAASVIYALENQQQLSSLRRAARQDAVAEHSAAQCMLQHAHLLDQNLLTHAHV